MLRFHLDEHVDHAIAHGLRSRAIDVTTATDPDEAHLEFGRREGRVVYTNDADFFGL